MPNEKKEAARAETSIIELSLGRLFEYQGMTDNAKDRLDFARLLFQQVYTAGLAAGAKLALSAKED